jgi:AraC family transcriptional regulator
MANPAEHIDAITKAIEYMKQNIDEELTSEKLAVVAGYSTYHFSRVFKEVTGVSPRHYLSALRIEAGKELLVGSSSQSILKTLLQVGFQSIGTFSAKFKQFVGLSPKQFQSNARNLHQFMNDFAEVNVELTDSLSLPAVKCEIEVPEGFKGLIFVGLFPRPIPDQRPIKGTALRESQKEYIFTRVPNGRFYAMAARFHGA